MNKKVFALPFLLFALTVPGQGQEYNPYVSNPSITPSPLPSELSGGTGVFSFTFGNSGSDTLSQFNGQKMVLEIDLSGGVPADDNPIESLGGSALDYFTWDYRDRKYVGTQSAIILPNASGTITIEYRVTSNSPQDDPGNGFMASIKAGPYNGENSGDNEISIYTWTQCVEPSAPQPEEPAQPTCSNPDGSVRLNGLPESGSWTITVSPGDRLVTGSGTTTTIDDLSPDTYRFTVTNSEGCTSDPSSEVVINSPPDAPAIPEIGTVTQPTCESASASVQLTGLPAGNWTITISPGGRSISGEGSSYTVTISEPGSYTFRVTIDGCVSEPSESVEIIEQPDRPSAPSVGEISQPGCVMTTGSVRLESMPSGAWSLTRQPGNVTTEGSSSSITISGLAPGTYTFTVTAGGCTSEPSDIVVINSIPSNPQPPSIGVVTQPACGDAGGSVVLSGLPSGSWTLTRTPGNTTIQNSGTRYTVSGLPEGTYTFTVTNSAGCVSASSEPVEINQPPDSPSVPVIGTITQPTCEVATGSVVLSGLPEGSWTIVRNPGGYRIELTGSTYTNAGLAPGSYTYSVINQAGCSSGFSSPVVINSSPAISTQPAQTIDCRNGAGNAIVTVTAPSGSSYEYRLDQGQFQTSPVFTGVPNGNHIITVRNSAGCSITGSTFPVSCGCVGGPVITLSSRNGSACGTSPVTLSGNTFGGSATQVNISEDGAGSVSPAQTGSSPFSFTYTPSTSDIGHTVTITVRTNNPVGDPCTEAVATYTILVNPAPATPSIGNIVHPTCNLSTGSLTLTGLPSSGSWTITRNPGAVSISGTGPTSVITGIESGSYTFTVSTAGSCVSMPTSPVVINGQPVIPRAPSAGTIVQPTCTIGTGSVVLNNLPSSGSWTLTRLPGTVTQTGTGTNVTVAGLTPGVYNFTVTNAAGCQSQPSGNVVINNSPPTPQPPVPGNITAPTCPVPTGSVAISGLPASGQWTIVSIPADIRLTGTGTGAQMRELLPGSYTFTVTNSAGCVSAPSAAVVIPTVPDAPVLVINNPAPVCSPATVNITSPQITAGSSPGLTYSYWINQNATISFDTPSQAGNGVYYIRGINAAECATVMMVKVTVLERPVASAGPDQKLEYDFTANISAEAPSAEESGYWQVLVGSGRIQNSTSPVTTVSNLGVGDNIFLWTVTNGVCPSSSDTLRIAVNDLFIPTMITPNNDGRNDYLILMGTEELEENELTIFDRRGVVVFSDDDYRNNWDGVDFNGKPLADDTYFFVFRARGVPPRSGYIVIRR